MTFASEFESQWSSLTAFLESEIITKADSKTGIDPKDIERKFENEKKRWLVPGQFNNTWLELLRKENRTVAEEFTKALEETKLEQSKLVTASSPALTILPAAGGAAVGLAACSLLSYTPLVTVIATVAGGVLGGSVGNGLSLKKRVQVGAQLREYYSGQLGQMGDSLKAIVKKADA